MNSQPYHQPSHVSPTEANPRIFDSRAQVDSRFEELELGLDNFTDDEIAPMGFADAQWNLGAGSGIGGMVPELGGGGLPNLPKPSEPWDVLRSAVLPPGRGVGNQQVSTWWAGNNMVQPENNQWHQHRSTAAGSPSSPSSRPTSSAQPISTRQKRRSTVPEPDSRVGDTHHCSKCGSQRRQTHHRNSSSPGTPHVASPALPSSTSYPIGQSLPSPRTPTQISGPDVLRDHGIDLAQLLSQASPARRQSLSMTTSRRGSQIRGPKRPVSETSHASHCTHHHAHSTQQEDFEGEGDEHDQEYDEGTDPRVTKVVLIYMQDCNCGAG
ncbi:hypothetical protein G7Y89_g13753 [Cudoniella acicularis]|uniref:Uncharacterized protein n=1 Tax=Cudoniella acicularis TaxID=354080 RepID=A0A8H4VVR8_9HELO|nr:hypothetical protein G7Y89_g13753 [Cudoniella acicularis]